MEETIEKIETPDKSRLLKIRIIVILFSISILIILLNLLFKGSSSIIQKESKQTFRSDISSLDAGIETIFDTYGIKKEWRYKKTIQVNDDFSRFERTIHLPYNIPIVNIVHDISRLCDKYEAVSSSTENIKLQILSVFIKYKGNIVGSIRFITDPSLERYKGIISFVLEDFNEIDELNRILMLQNSLYNTFVLNPEDKVEKEAGEIAKFGKEYFLFLDIKNENSDDKYNISLGLDSAKIKNRLKNLFRTFEKSSGILYRVSDTSKKMFSFIKKESERYKKYFININRFTRLIEIENGFKNIDDVIKEASTNGNALAICRLRKKNLEKIHNIFSSTQKKGFKFSRIEEIINQNNLNE